MRIINTPEEFVELCRERNLFFLLTPGGYIRDSYGCCPISALANSYLGERRYVREICRPAFILNKNFGIDLFSSSAIAAYSDNYSGAFNPLMQLVYE